MKYSMAIAMLLASACLMPASAEVPAACLELPTSGPCMALFWRFAYNPATKSCETFVYGGCRANGNNFKTEHECKQTCQVAA